MNILAGAFIEAELKITGEQLIFYRVAAGREDRVAALIGKFKADDLARADSCDTAKRSCVKVRLTGC